MILVHKQTVKKYDSTRLPKRSDWVKILGKWSKLSKSTDSTTQNIQDQNRIKKYFLIYFWVHLKRTGPSRPWVYIYVWCFILSKIFWFNWNPSFSSTSPEKKKTFKNTLFRFLLKSWTRQFTVLWRQRLLQLLPSVCSVLFNLLTSSSAFEASSR